MLRKLLEHWYLLQAFVDAQKKPVWRKLTCIACTWCELAEPAFQSLTLSLLVSVCRQYVQLKTGQDLPREGVEAALDEVLASYKSELGLTDKETDQLEHFQVSTLPCLLPIHNRKELHRLFPFVIMATSNVPDTTLM